MPTLRERAIAYFQRRFPRAPVLDRTGSLIEVGSGTVLKAMHLLVAYDTDAALKQSLVAIPNLGSHDEVKHIATDFPQWIADLQSTIMVGGGNTLAGHYIEDSQMVDSPKAIIYTDVLHCPRQQVLKVFSDARRLIELVHESEMHDTVFISYGGPDQSIAYAINDYLKKYGVQTWFFPESAVPGQKLHRVMSEGVEKHDRVLLICSSSSLNRPGVQNELERVLEREAREGGSEILIPITIDQFVFSEWTPARPDLARQVRSRVIATFPASAQASDEFRAAAAKLLEALQK